MVTKPGLSLGTSNISTRVGSDHLSFFFFFYFIHFWLRWVFVAARGLSLVAASGGSSSLRCTGSKCAGLSGSRAQAQQLCRKGLVAPWHAGSSWTRTRTRIPCNGRWILNHCATREAHHWSFNPRLLNCLSPSSQVTEDYCVLGTPPGSAQIVKLKTKLTCIKPPLALLSEKGHQKPSG